jgi:dUTP pyrophosphatase
VLRLVHNPTFDPDLTGALVRIWTAVANVGGVAGSVPPVDETIVRPVAEAAFERVEAGEEDLVVAFETGQPVGFGFLAGNQGLHRHWAAITRLQRDPAWRGRGVGAAVLAALERIAAERGLDFVTLTVCGGTGRERFFEAHGYQVVAVLPGWLHLADGDVRDESVLVKPLRASSMTAGPLMRVRRLDPGLPLPTYAHPGDAGLDLCASQDVTLSPGERAIVPTGVAVAIPPGCVGLVHPRSGLAARHGLTLVNTPGTIDAGYRGEIKVILINLDPTQPIHLRRSDRVAQLVIQRVETVCVQEVPDLDHTTRGDGGFGSTGR